MSGLTVGGVDQRWPHAPRRDAAGRADLDVLPVDPTPFEDADGYCCVRAVV
jgi:hypothetical protein